MSCKVLIGNTERYEVVLTAEDGATAISGATLTAALVDTTGAVELGDAPEVADSSASMDEDAETAGTYTATKPHGLAIDVDGQYRVKVTGTYPLDGQTMTLEAYSDPLVGAYAVEGGSEVC